MEDSRIRVHSDHSKILDNTSTHIQSIDLTGKILYVNEAWKNTLGYTDVSILGESIFSVLGKKSHQDYQQILDQIAGGKEPGRSNIVYIRKTGEEVVLSGLISILRSDDGEIIGTSEFLKISDYIDEPYDMRIPVRRKADERQDTLKELSASYDQSDVFLDLRHSDSNINRFLDAIYDLVFFKDVEGYYRGCNNNFAELLNLPKEKIIGYTDYDLYPDEIADLFREKDAQILKDHTPRKNEEWVTLSDGTRSFIETLKTPYFGKDNKVIGFLGVSRDITERKLTEDKLAENEMWLNIYFTQSQNAKFFLMLEHPVPWMDIRDQNVNLNDLLMNLKLSRVNPSLLALYDMSEEEIRSLDAPFAFLSEAENGTDNFRKLLEEKHATSYFKKTLKEGKEIYISADHMCLYDEKEQLIGIFGNHKDITREVLSDKKMREREMHLRTVLETTRDGYFALDEEAQDRGRERSLLQNEWIRTGRAPWHEHNGAHHH